MPQRRTCCHPFRVGEDAVAWLDHQCGHVPLHHGDAQEALEALPEDADTRRALDALAEMEDAEAAEDRRRLREDTYRAIEWVVREDAARRKWEGALDA